MVRTVLERCGAGLHHGKVRPSTRPLSLAQPKITLQPETRVLESWSLMLQVVEKETRDESHDRFAKRLRRAPDIRIRPGFAASVAPVALSGPRPTRRGPGRWPREFCFDHSTNLVF